MQSGCYQGFAVALELENIEVYQDNCQRQLIALQ
jgi:hypothetical protein